MRIILVISKVPWREYDALASAQPRSNWVSVGRLRFILGDTVVDKNVVPGEYVVYDILAEPA